MTILALDPGPEQTAWLELQPAPIKILGRGIDPNIEVINRLRDGPRYRDWTLAVEMIASYGMPVGAEVFETCVWIGRFVEAWKGSYSLVYRREVKMHLCGSSRAKDPNIRQALLDQFGPGRDKAIGTKKAPGPLYGIKADLWAALGVAVTWRAREIAA